MQSVDFRAKPWAWLLGHSPGRFQLATAWLLALSLTLFMAWGALQFVSHRQQMQQSEQTRQALQKRLDALGLAERAPKVAQPKANASQAKRMAEAVQALNAPWQGLVQTLEGVEEPAVSLIELDAQASGAFTLLIEAPSYQQLMRYVERLAAQPAIARVSLSQHEQASNAVGSAVRMTVQGSWGEPVTRGGDHAR